MYEIADVEDDDWKRIDRQIAGLDRADAAVGAACLAGKIEKIRCQKEGGGKYQ